MKAKGIKQELIEEEHRTKVTHKGNELSSSELSKSKSIEQDIHELSDFTPRRSQRRRQETHSAELLDSQKAFDTVDQDLQKEKQTKDCAKQTKESSKQKEGNSKKAFDAVNKDLKQAKPTKDSALKQKLVDDSKNVFDTFEKVLQESRQTKCFTIVDDDKPSSAKKSSNSKKRLARL